MKTIIMATPMNSLNRDMKSKTLEQLRKEFEGNKKNFEVYEPLGMGIKYDEVWKFILKAYEAGKEEEKEYVRDMINSLPEGSLISDPARVGLKILNYLTTKGKEK